MQTILLVDDEYSIVEVLTHLLEEEGYTVVTAANGRDGLDRASEKVPDLVITDLMMPIMDGDELLRELRKSAALRKVPVILITSAPAPGFRDGWGAPGPRLRGCLESANSAGFVMVETPGSGVSGGGGTRPDSDAASRSSWEAPSASPRKYRRAGFPRR